MLLDAKFILLQLQRQSPAFGACEALAKPGRRRRQLKHSEREAKLLLPQLHIQSPGFCVPVGAGDGADDVAETAEEPFARRHPKHSVREEKFEVPHTQVQSPGFELAVAAAVVTAG